MFKDNLTMLRKAKGFSQEALAERLHVVRQTISKWEKGISVPDAEMLIRLADILDTSVAALLGDVMENTADRNMIGSQLEQLNAIMAERNRRSRRIWRIVAIILIAFVVLNIVAILLSYGAFDTYSTDPTTLVKEYAINP